MEPKCEKCGDGESRSLSGDDICSVGSCSECGGSMYPAIHYITVRMNGDWRRTVSVTGYYGPEPRQDLFAAIMSAFSDGLGEGHCLLTQILALHDHKGQLTVTWATEPSEAWTRAAHNAWDSPMIRESRMVRAQGSLGVFHEFKSPSQREY